MFLPPNAEATSRLNHLSRRRWTALLAAAFLGLFSAAGSAALSKEAPEVVTLRPADGLELTTRPAASNEAVARLASPSARCSEEMRRTAEVTLSWTPATSAETAVQRLEITKFRDGFSALRAERSDELATHVNAVTVQAPEAGILYRWRVLTRMVDGEWLASDEGRFEVPICVWDGE